MELLKYKIFNGISFEISADAVIKMYEIWIER